MKKSISALLTAGFFLAGINAADAAPLTPEQALARLGSSRQMKKIAPAARPQMRLALTESAAKGGVYIFSSQDSAYYITPTDDCAPALLGYGENFDPENIPSSMKWWLAEYARQISYMAENGITAEPAAANHDKVTPLVSTTWDQDDPYNRDCPLSSGVRCVTGCVATATAQVINYNRWPEGNGIGTHSYRWGSSTLSFDYGATAFDWSKMANSYAKPTTATQKNAVAKLMYAVGVGVNMNYTSSASGAHSLSIPRLLIENLGYDKGAAFMMRDYFSADEWDRMIYAELAAGRPVIYSGVTARQEGHCFVCDGYNGNGMYHINWGWGGVADGYFALSALDPDSQGIGGSVGAFSYAQDAIIGIQPPVEGSVEFLPVYADTGFTYSEQNGIFKFVNGYFNYSPLSANIQTGLKIVAEDNDSIIYVSGSDVTLKGIGSSGNLSGYSVIDAAIPLSIPAGSYRVYPACRPADGGAWQQIMVPYGKAEYVTVRVGNNGAVTYDGSDPEEKSSSLSVVIKDDVLYSKSGSQVRIPVSIVNTGAAQSSTYSLRMENIKTINTLTAASWNFSNSAEYNLTFTPDVPDGRYLARFFSNANSMYVSNTATVYVGTVPTSVSLAPSALDLTVGASATVLADVLPANAFDRTVAWESDDKAVALVDAYGLVTAVSEGTATLTATTINDLTATITVSVAASSGIEDIEAVGDALVDVYNLQGILLRKAVDPAVATIGLPTGVYIVGGKRVMVR